MNTDADFFDGVQTPLTVNRVGGNPGGWLNVIQAKFDEKPTEQDICAASASIGYGRLPWGKPEIEERFFGGYILGTVKAVNKEADRELVGFAEVQQLTEGDEEGLWLAAWSAICD